MTGDVDHVDRIVRSLHDDWGFSLAPWGKTPFRYVVVSSERPPWPGHATIDFHSSEAVDWIVSRTAADANVSMTKAVELASFAIAEALWTPSDEQAAYGYTVRYQPAGHGFEQVQE